MRIGIDVGGTNTDAVLMEGMEVLASHKTPTSADVGSGITSALQNVFRRGSCRPEDVTAVMIGTTHFTNAVVERRRLLESAAIRIALPATQALPPMVDWPPDLREAIGNHVYMVHGGYEFDGREISPLDEKEILEVAADLKRKGIRSVALTSVFAPVNAAMEQRAAAILRDQIPDLFVSLSSEIGRIGLLERENATIVNACLQELAINVVRSFREALNKLKIDAPFYISQNDGTLMSSDYAEKYPILTFASGPTNSMRGAAFLSEAKEAIVVDIGGTTSDVGALSHGFPREASAEVEIANVRTNFRMPDLVSFGLGGGSIVRQDNGRLTIGPDSVGYELSEKALVFGGSTLTATDIAVAAGQLELGDRSRVRDLPAALVERALALIHETVETSVDRMKTSAEPIPVLLVGGGSVLIARPIAGASEVSKPANYAVANAIGAAIAQVGGEVDRVFSLEGSSRDVALAAAKQEAADKAIQAGARPDTVQIVDVEEVPLTYLPTNAVRMRIKAVGDLVMS
ncbi:MAG: hydantoinase subunit beta [Candidatus Nephthysia bennettiae]|uniref:Hydantoinase/oxoprolinase family protein n=1 Tax=Candidatus Nephthysia bennettiae TaxID=3127016 RepID=A0A934N920_9BACT|nr:hydantoinase/oxoprolinase family protein [Candidatus Dormibacteraeota bacterium]MBJ7613559.1 hydantoinase/oxoprolinase family protein [Candidatus Dormibacteraeota bacterium]PZR87373.1 MAG: hydantoinase subunit beta [Candidatus Dormibacteraeota bacterium]